MNGNIAYKTDELVRYLARSRVTWTQCYDSERVVIDQLGYVVLNAASLIRDFVNLSPTDISAYGYWRPPSATAVTPYEQLCFCAVSAGKRNGGAGGLKIDLRLPEEILAVIESP